MVALLLVISIGTFFRIDGHDLIKPVLFISILVMGLFAGILLSDVAHLLRSKKGDKDRLV